MGVMGRIYEKGVFYENRNKYGNDYGDGIGDYGKKGKMGKEKNEKDNDV